MFTRIIRFTKKILRGESLVKVKYSATEWDVQFKKGNWNFLHERHLNVLVVTNLIKDMLDQKGSLTILDVGCGNGALIKELAGLPITYTGVDISVEALEQARQFSPQSTFIQASMDDDPPITGVYDVVIFCEVLLYGDYEMVLQRYRPHLAKDGFVIVSLYEAWRSSVIWYTIRRILMFRASLYVKNQTRGVGWNIKVGTYR